MDRESLIEEIKADLGEPTVRVELDDTYYDIIINKALRWFKAKKGMIRHVPVPAVLGQTEYPYPADCYQLLEVVLPRNTQVTDITNLDFFDIIPANLFNTANGNLGTPGTMRFETAAYVQVLQALDMRRRVFGADPEWFDTGTGFFISPKNLSGNMFVFYKTKNVAITDFIGRDEDLVYRYCLAKAKLALGEIRSKYSGYPAAGGPIAMNGGELKQEAAVELLALEEEINESQGNAGGITVG